MLRPLYSAFNMASIGQTPLLLDRRGRLGFSHVVHYKAVVPHSQLRYTAYVRSLEAIFEKFHFISLSKTLLAVSYTWNSPIWLSLLIAYNFDCENIHVILSVHTVEGRTILKYLYFLLFCNPRAVAIRSIVDHLFVTPKLKQNEVIPIYIYIYITTTEKFVLGQSNFIDN